MSPQIRHVLLRYYTLLALLAAFGLVAYVWFNGRPDDWEPFIPAFGVLLSSVYFVQKQRLDELRVFKELFAEFNARYDRVNGRLATLLSKSAALELEPEDKSLLVDYFNLCSEEFLYYRSGYIPPVVWNAWRNGMKVFRGDQRIRQFWDEELKSQSYYGLRFD